MDPRNPFHVSLPPPLDGNAIHLCLQHGGDSEDSEGLQDLREKYGFSADLTERHLQEKLEEMREHLRREIRKVTPKAPIRGAALTHYTNQSDGLNRQTQRN